MKYFRNVAYIAIYLAVVSCKTALTPSTQDDGKLEAVFVQVNDVYEIAPLAGGKEGGMARVATLKKQNLKNNPNTFLVIAGDFLSPSVYNSLQYEGKNIRGRQMIEAMNAAGMDFAVFGNHEFDLKESDLQDRLNESTFQWISSNAFHKQAGNMVPFARNSGHTNPPFPKSLIITLQDKDGTTAKIGLLGITAPYNRADFVSYTPDPTATAREIYQSLKDSVDAIVAITHQSVEEDRKLAKALPGLALIIGGHEHDMRLQKEGNVYITKAHANAKSAYVIKLELNKKTGALTVVPELKLLDDKVALDSSTNVVVQKWMDIAEKSYRSLGFDPKNIVLATGEPLDGREDQIRHHPTNLTKLMMAAFAAAVPRAEVVLANAGSIRVDDILPMPLTQYDIVRSLPFGGSLQEVEMKGTLLTKVLEQGRKNAGNGGYLHYNEALNYDTATNSWKLKNEPISAAKTYRVALTDYLLTGKETNLDYLNSANPDIVQVFKSDAAVPNPQSDIRLAIVNYLEKKL